MINKKFTDGKFLLCRLSGKNFADGKQKNCHLAGMKFAVGQRDTCRRQTFHLPTANKKFAIGKCAAG
ncbi:MAG TPA: hypothetical protein IAA30_01540, partial [Candidatus Treponema faecavium]|nr:hypothetical protein [Candidatus Treponema faecavium]